MFTRFIVIRHLVCSVWLYIQMRQIPGSINGLKLKKLIHSDKYRLTGTGKSSTKCSPKASSCNTIFCSVLAANIVHYDLQPKTLNLVPPGLVRNVDQPAFLIKKVFRRSRRRPWSCNKLPQTACNKESAEKSLDLQGDFSGFWRNTVCILSLSFLSSI